MMKNWWKLLIGGAVVFVMSGCVFYKTQKHLSKSIVKLDFSGINTFTTIARELVADREPSEKMWTALEKTPGYDTLLQNEFAPDYFRRNFRLALMPSRSVDLRQEIKNGQARYLPYYLEISKQISDIPSFTEHLKKSAAPQRAVDIVCQWLPSFLAPIQLPVAVVIFGPDGRGYDPIVIDLFNSVKQQEEELSLFLAHEFHHYFRNLFKIFKSPAGIDDTEMALLV
ncbi:MAG: hypothetical protein L6420_00140 [Elusimicrobia bacterium]|nr:hypothetical protein [Elusimicrobiota bacterium]